MKLIFSSILIICLSFMTYVISLHMDPSDYFTGAQHRPRLEILYPENGQILDDGDLEILIKIEGYDLPSHFHDSSVCVGLSTGDIFAENCFDQTPDLVFHANGLSPGTQYVLRIAFFERGNAIAVSVRTFKVAGIRGLLGNENEVVSIQTAVQVAIDYQTSGMEQQAEYIYRSILTENPSHPDALHNLGVIFYQKGDPISAIPYIERALMGNKTSEGFHNSLGECYRILGRSDEARNQFKMALSINPKYYYAIYNLGLTYQQLRLWDTAIMHYRSVLKAVKANPNVISKKTNMEIKIRECDLVTAQQRQEAMACWEEAIELFPGHDIMYNELGNLYAQRGDYENALLHYREAAFLGSYLAELNAAHMLELQGYSFESKSMFEVALEKAQQLGSPQFHVRIRIATVLPRIMPSLNAELVDLRQATEISLNYLLSTDAAELNFVVDNASPLHFGFSHGFHYAFHGLNNKMIKMKLHRVYSRLCPALLQGHFMDKLNAHGMTATYSNAPFEEVVKKDVTLMVVTKSVTAKTIDGTQSKEKDVESLRAIERNDFGEPTRAIRVGFASRHLTSSTAVGVLCGAIIPKLALEGFEIILFLIDGQKDEDELDPVRSRVLKGAHKVVYLPLDLDESARAIRNNNLDILIYPEIGMDPISYFLSYSRLAPIQAAWFGHPDTTGIATIDYFISSEIEVPSAESFYSEKLYRMPKLGTEFLDYWKILSNHEVNNDASSSQIDVGAVIQASLQHRARLIESLGLPKSSHLYVIAHPLYVLHGSFDEALARILVQDRLGYIIIVDVAAYRPTWQDLFTMRVAGKFSNDVKARIIFISAGNSIDLIGQIMAGHCLLDPFPVSGFLPSLQALSVGVPVVSFPSDKLGGRFTLALYDSIDYGIDSMENKGNLISSILEKNNKSSQSSNNLVVSSVSDYVKVALALAHSTQLRAKHATEILKRRHLLFGDSDDKIIKGWKDFLFYTISESELY